MIKQICDCGGDHDKCTALHRLCDVKDRVVRDAKYNHEQWHDWMARAEKAEKKLADSQYQVSKLRTALETLKNWPRTSRCPTCDDGHDYETCTCWDSMSEDKQVRDIAKAALAHPAVVAAMTVLGEKK